MRILIKLFAGFHLIVVSGTAMSFAQCVNFPQELINRTFSSVTSQQQIDLPSNQNKPFPASTFQLLNKINQSPFSISGFVNEKVQNTDTTFVGLNVNDTLVITGTWTGNGPVLVFNHGVLIFENANATILGNLYVFQNGKVFADSSTLFFPQQYFYQRMLLTADSGYAEFNYCTFDFSGLSHNLFAAGTSSIALNHSVNLDWTTAGVAGSPTVSVNGSNLTGEYILSDSATFNFKNANTLLLWHHFPGNAVINYSFPPGDSVYAYSCNNSTPGISGVQYHVNADSCYNVWWGMMPVNGSDVTISNSNLRAIGLWFQNGDSASVSGLTNNSNYTSFTAPLADRNLQLNNTSVQTWSLYVFDSSALTLTGCIVGEVGTQSKSSVNGTSFFCDGSGGYLWATDTSVVIASQASTSSNVRSERNGFMIFGYGSVGLGAATAINNSVLIVVQSSLPQDPVPLDGANAWFANIASPPTSNYVDSTVVITGSAWIDQGPLGSFLDFGKYKLWYKPASGGTWTAVNNPSFTEVHNNTLATWNTTGLAPGSYALKLVLFDQYNDSVEAATSIVLLPKILSLNDNILYPLLQVYPNPSSHVITFSVTDNLLDNFLLSLYDTNGKLIRKLIRNDFKQERKCRINTDEIDPGLYYYTLLNGESYFKGKVMVVR